MTSTQVKEFEILPNRQHWRYKIFFKRMFNVPSNTSSMWALITMRYQTATYFCKVI